MKYRLNTKPGSNLRASYYIYYTNGKKFVITDTCGNAIVAKATDLTDLLAQVKTIEDQEEYIHDS